MVLNKQIQKDLESFTIRPYRTKRLDRYFAEYNRDNLVAIHDDNVKDMLLAQGFCPEDNPRSIYRVEKLYEALSRYAPSKVPYTRATDNVWHGISLARTCFARPKSADYLHVMPMTPQTVCTVTSNPSGSPGLTAFGATKAESMTRALERGLQTLSGEKQPEPCLGFKRTQFNNKTRLVWGFPYSMTVIEGLVAHPLNQRFQEGATPMAYSISSGALGTKLRVAAYHKEYAYSLDMSQYDAHLSGWLIHQAFKILRTWYDPCEIEPVSNKTVKEIFDIIEYYFVHTTIVMPDGRIYIGKKHGVPSGSFFTQMIDSICNVMIAGAISSRFNLHISRREIFVLGDDLLFWSNRKVDLDVISKYARDDLGVLLHGEEKSKIYHYDEVIHYLGRNWDNGLPDLDEKGIIDRMYNCERWRKYDKKDYKKKQRQVRMLILSFASNYRTGWRIAYELLDGSHTHTGRGCCNLDVNVYCRDLADAQLELDPDMLSGLMRYRLKYLGAGSRSDIPITAMQYWL